MPTANADAPTSLSRVLLLGLHRVGGSPDEVDLPLGVGSPRRSDGNRKTLSLTGGVQGEAKSPLHPP
jgi:hypothetical protein